MIHKTRMTLAHLVIYAVSFQLKKTVVWDLGVVNELWYLAQCLYTVKAAHACIYGEW